MKQRVYLDWAAAAPLHTSVVRVWKDAAAVFANPSSTHMEGQAAKAELERARTEIARTCAAKPRAVVFTSGATEANAIAIEGRIAHAHATGVPYAQMHALVLPTAHASTRAAFERIAKLGVHVEELLLKDNVLDVAAAAKQLRPETVLVSCDAADSVTGVRYDTRALAQAVSQQNAPQAFVHVDASQLPLVESLERTRLGADLLVLDAQKIGGVRGIGALIGPGIDHVAPLYGGGGQERGLRSGTEPVLLATAFAKALASATDECADFAARAKKDREQLIHTLISVTAPILPAPLTITEGRDQLPHILSITLPGVDTEYLSYLLDAKGFAVSTGSACDIGKNDAHSVPSRLRISWGPATRSRDLHKFPAALAACIPLASLPVPSQPSTLGA